MFTESTSPLPRPAPDHHRRFVAARLNVSHLMASAAIPALFPSVRVDEPAEAAGWYVDGATRRRVPLAPALELNADRVVVVGTGGLRPPDSDTDLDAVAVDLGDGLATLLGAVMRARGPSRWARSRLRRWITSERPGTAPAVCRMRCSGEVKDDGFGLRRHTTGQGAHQAGFHRERQR